MYEYNFNEMRTNIEQILDISLAENKDRYYNQLEVFKNNKNINGNVTFPSYIIYYNLSIEKSNVT